MEGPPGELAVPHFAAAGEAEAAGLADAVGREIVVQQEVFAVIDGQAVDDLLVLSGTQRGDHQGLGLAPGEKRAAVGAGQDSDLRRDGPDGAGIAAVDALAGLQDALAHDFLFQALDDVGKVPVQAILFQGLR